MKPAYKIILGIISVILLSVSLISAIDIIEDNKPDNAVTEFLYDYMSKLEKKLFDLFRKKPVSTNKNIRFFKKDIFDRFRTDGNGLSIEYEKEEGFGVSQYVCTGSMYPTFNCGDICLTKQAHFLDEINIDDIIVFSIETIEDRIVHRVVKKNDDYIVTKGDNNAFKDNYRLNMSNNISIVVAIVKTGYKEFYEYNAMPK